MTTAAWIYAVLSAGSALSVLAGRPWTSIISRRTNPPELWGNPVFLETNNLLSGTWALLFGGAALVAKFGSPMEHVSAGVAMTLLGLASNRIGRWYSERKLEALGIEVDSSGDVLKSLQDQIDSANPWNWPPPALEVAQSAAGDLDVIVRELGERFPAERRRVRALFEEIKAVHDGLYSTAAWALGVPRPPESVEGMLEFAANEPTALRWRHRPFLEMLNDFLRDAELKKFLAVLTGYLTDRPGDLTVGNMAPIFGYYFNGGRYPVGGSQRLPDGYRSSFGTLETSTSGLAVQLVVDCVPDVEPITIVSGDCGLGFAMSIPSLIDPELAPSGCAAIELLSFVGKDEAITWDREDPDYESRKRKACDGLVERAAALVPGLAEAIIFREDSTPRTYEHFACTEVGSIYGPATASNRPPAKTPVRGLVLAGSSVFPGPGVEAVVISGALAAHAIDPSGVELLGVHRQEGQAKVA
jgi:hypothetical protein